MKIFPLAQKDFEFLIKSKEDGFIDAWSNNDLEGSMESGRFLGFIAKDEDRPLGYITCSLTDFDLDIESVFVSPAYRKRGIAKTLLAEVINLAKSKGLESIFLEVRKSNLPAINLYKSAGFNFISERKRYYFDGEDAVCMKREMAK